VRGITSQLTIQWFHFDNKVRRVENTTGNIVGDSMVYRDLLNISSLTCEDDYWYIATINAMSHNMQLRDLAMIRLKLTCKCYCIYIHSYIHTHAYIHTYIRSYVGNCHVEELF